VVGTFRTVVADDLEGSAGIFFSKIKDAEAPHDVLSIA
jgi:hypothetical protein